MLTIHDLLQSAPEILRRKGEKILDEKNLWDLRRENQTLTSTVKDGHMYKQTITLKGMDLLSYQCTCHDGPALCSHLVALLLRVERKSLTSFSQRKKPKAYLSHEKDDLQKMLEGADKEDLISFILSLRSSYRDMPLLIRKNFIGISGGEFLKESQEKLNSSYKTLKSETEKDFSRHGTLILKVHEKAREEALQRNYVGASLLYLLLFEMVSREPFSVEGYLFHGQYIKTYEEALLTLSEKKYTGVESHLIFQYLHEISRNLMDLSECSTLMKIMKGFLTTEKDFDGFYDTLLHLLEKKDLPPLGRDHLLFLEYELLMMVDKEKEAHTLQHENPEVFEFLFMEAKLLAKNGDFNGALALCDQEILHEARNWDHKIQWLYFKARILKKLHEIQALLQVTLSLLALGEYKAYMSLKKTVAEETWPALYEVIAEDSGVKESIKGVYLRILLEEEDKKRLLSYTKDHRKSIQEHYEFLHPEYGDEASELLTTFILDEVRGLKTKRDPSSIMSLIEKLYIYGHEELATETIMAIVMNDKYKTSFHTALFSLKDTYVKDSPYEEEKF